MTNAGRWVWLIVVVGVVLRAVFCGLVVGWERDPIGDEIDYHTLATNVSEGEGYRAGAGHLTARRPPLYPLALAALYRVVGPSIVWARLAQVLLGGLIIWLVYRVALRYFAAAAACIAAGLTALNPFLVFISGYVLTENLYVILLLSVLLLLPRVDSLSEGWPRLVGAGLLFGLAALGRPTAMGLVWWVVIGFVLIGSGPAPGRVLRSAAMLAVVLLSLMPWAFRNHEVLGKWVFFTLHGGTTFYQGNNAKVLEVPQYRGSVAPLYMLPGHDELSRMSELEQDQAAWAMGKQFLREHKSDVPLLVARKFGRFWRFKSESGMSGIKSGWWFDKESPLGRLATLFDVGMIYAVFVIPLFVLGLVLTYRDRRKLFVLYGVIVVHTGAALVFHGSIRMRLPIEPVMAIFAAEAIRHIGVRIRSRRLPAASDTTAV